MQPGQTVEFIISGFRNQGTQTRTGTIHAFLPAGHSARLALPEDMIGANNNIKVARFSSKAVDFDNDRYIIQIVSATQPPRYFAVKPDKIKAIGEVLV